MPYRKLPGGIGKVYVPEERPDNPKKHNCKDCFFCQQCSDARCDLCRGGGRCPIKQRAPRSQKPEDQQSR